MNTGILQQLVSTTRPAIVVVCAVSAVTVVALGIFWLQLPDPIEESSTGEALSFSSYSGEDTNKRDVPTTEDTDEAAPSESSPDSHADEPLQWAHEERWELLEPFVPPAFEESTVATGDDGVDATDSEPHRPAGAGRSGGPTGRLVVVTNFTRAQVTVNGEPYPAYSDDGQNRGMQLAANQSHEVFVEFNDSQRIYDITLRPGERRMLMVELTGMNGGSATGDRSRTRRGRRDDSRRSDDDDGADGDGRLTVYSRPPRANVFVGGTDMDDRTPATVTVEAGRHEVQVEYEDGEMSEVKTVRVREGAQVRLFFRRDQED